MTMTKDLLLEEGLAIPLLQGVIAGSDELTVHQTVKPTSTDGGEHVESSKHSYTVQSSLPCWRIAFCFMDIVPILCFLKLFIAHKIFADTLVDCVGGGTNGTNVPSAEQDFFIALLVVCSFLSLVVATTWFLVRDLVLILASGISLSEEEKKVFVDKSDVFPFLRYAILREVLEIAPWSTFHEYRSQQKGPWEYEIFWPKNGFTGKFVVFMIADTLCINAPVGLLYMPISIFYWLYCLEVFQVDCRRVHVRVDKAFIIGFLLIGYCCMILATVWRYVRYYLLVRIAIGERQIPVVDMLAYLELFGSGDFDVVHEWDSLRIREKHLGKSINMGFCCCRLYESMHAGFRSQIEYAPREELLDETEEYLAHLKFIIVTANKNVTRSQESCTHSIHDASFSLLVCDNQERRMLQTILTRTFTFLRLMDVRQIDRRDVFRPLCYDIVRQFTKHAWGMMTFEDLRYTVYAFERDSDCQFLLWDALVEHLPSYIDKRKARTLAPKQLYHLLKETLTIHHQQIPSWWHQNGHSYFRKSESIVQLHSKFPHMMDWWHRYQVSASDDNTNLA